MRGRAARLAIAAATVAGMLVVPAPVAPAEPVTCATRTWDSFGAADPPLEINGDAAVTGGGALRVAPASEFRAGSAFTTERISLASGATFSTYFQFQLSGQGNGGADGLVFVVQTVSNSVGSDGGGIGYQGLADSVGIELDNWYNGENGDPSISHVGIDQGGSLHSNPVVDLLTHPAPDVAGDLDDGAVRHAWVDYDGATLQVRLSRSAVRPSDPLLAAEVDLPAALGMSAAESPSAFVGFTSATGAAWADHDVLFWQLNSCYAPIEPPDATVTVDLAGSPVSSGFGHATVPYDAVEPAALAEAGAAAAPDDIAATPLGSIDIRGQIVASPLGSIPLGSIPLGSIPLGSIPLGSIPLGSIPLGSISLADLPVDFPDGWRALLDCAGQQPACDDRFADASLQELTLAMVLEALPQVQALDLRQLGLGATPLGSIPLGSIALADVPISAILDAIRAELEDACARSTPAGVCDDLAVFTNGQDVTLLSLGLAGVPLGSIPLGSIPLGSIPLGSIPLGSIPLGSIDLAVTPLGSIPLGSIPLGSIPLGSIPLGSIPLGSIPLGSIPLGSIPLGSIGAIVDCAKVDCQTGTLADALAADAILPDAELAQLLGTPEFDALTLLDLLVTAYNGTTLAELIETGAGAGVELGALLAGLLPRADYPWEDVDLSAPAVRGAAVAAGGATAYTATIAVVGGPADVELSVEPPPGAAYVPGSATLDGSALDDPVADGTALRWSLAALADGTHTVAYSARPAMFLGAVTTTATATAAGSSAEPATDSFDGFVVDDPDVGATPAGALPLDPDAITLSHVGQQGDVDLYSLEVGPSALVSISLSNLTFDGDLVLYAPPADLPGAEPVQVLPPVEETLAASSTGETSAAPLTLDDVPRLDLPVYAVAAHRGTVDEVIGTAPLREGTYLVQVSGYNGAFGSAPYALRAKVLPGPELPACPARALDLGAPGELPALSSLPAALDTIFLVNEQRLEATHPGALAGVRASLDGVAGATGAGVVGAVVPVDGDPAVRQAYAAWDTAEGRCSPAAANTVASTIADVVARIRAARPSLRNIVLVGPDDQVPMGRVPDTTSYANERGFGATFPALDEVAAALRAGFYLSDDVYADAAPLGVGLGRLYVPELAVGRLVHTPAQIIAALDRFVATSGVIDDESGLVTGYDFLTDGADSIVAGLTSATRTVVTLIDDTWSRQDLVDALLPSGPGAAAPNVASINAHFDPARALPAEGNAAHDESDLFTTADVRNATGTPLVGRLLFSMGCHAGLNLPAADADTWAKAFADEGALWVANTGYGYGDTETVALSELLMSHFAENLDRTLTVGDALSLAKQRFAGDLGVVGAYDMKSLMQSTFYGLPMYRLASSDGDPGGPSPTPPPTFLDPLTGLQVTTVGIQPQLTRQSSAAGDWYEAGGEPLTVAGQPVQPKTSVDVTHPRAVAHGALLTGLTTRDVGGFLPRIFRPIVDLAANEAAFRPDEVAFPAAFQAVRDEIGPDGRRQHLVLVPGQFVSDPAAVDGRGTQRLFESMTAQVHFAAIDDVEAAADFDPPTITGTVGHTLPDAVTFAVEADDAQGPVKRVLVLWSIAPDGGTGTPRAWQATDLVESAPGRWSGGAAVAGVDEDAQVEYLVQAVDAVGNVGTSSNKGLLFHALTAASGPLSFDVTGPQSGGVYTGPVSITVGGVEGTASYFLDGAGPTPLTDAGVAVSDDGVHLLEVTTSSGQTGQHAFVIDTSAPTVAISSPVDGGHYVLKAVVPARYHCADGGLGVASCTGTKADGAPIDTATIGQKQFAVVAVDQLDNQTSATSTYRVVYGICVVGNPGGKAGSTVQIELRVCDAAGANLSRKSLTVTAVSVDGAPPNKTGQGTGRDFMFNNGRKSYMTGIKTKGLAKGEHTLTVSVAGDPIPKTVIFTLR